MGYFPIWIIYFSSLISTLKRQSRCNFWLVKSLYWLIWKGFLFWSCLFTLSPSVHCWLLSEDTCQNDSLSGQVAVLTLCSQKHVRIHVCRLGLCGKLERLIGAFSVSAESQLSHELGCLCVPNVKITFREWTLQNGNVEAILQSQNPRLRQLLIESGVKYEQNRLRRAGEMHMTSIKLYTVLCDPDFLAKVTGQSRGLS